MNFVVQCGKVLITRFSQSILIATPPFFNEKIGICLDDVERKKPLCQFYRETLYVSIKFCLPNNNHTILSGLLKGETVEFSTENLYGKSIKFSFCLT